MACPNITSAHLHQTPELIDAAGSGEDTDAHRETGWLENVAGKVADHKADHRFQQAPRSGGKSNPVCISGMEN